MNGFITMKRLLKIEDIEKLGLGKRTTIWRKVNSGEFPKPIKLGTSPQSPIRWSEEAINEYLNNLFANNGS
tara:strand:+ start:614 stop:826 length:213 start_codon:yes stop_codon:yes gene_type:complete